ncbi:SLCO1B3 [Branchiostoma lanceolatum]|uniref:Solute carrier organic anion transporter family member n=1 Tax=Branchiostoma lanceolatum TaxID=7740 RepID=A0A8J9ZQH0_BRALA|nr:SLCO1B3 [Branchiostoma lanceolatum]
MRQKMPTHQENGTAGGETPNDVKAGGSGTNFANGYHGEKSAEKPVDDAETTVSCGLGSWRPNCIQKCANAKMFCFVLAWFMFFEGLMYSGFFKGAITSLEKQFRMTSSVSGTLATVAEITTVVVVTFVTYIGGKSHRPIIVGAGSILLGLGSILMGVTHWWVEIYDYGGAGQNLTTNQCTAGNGSDSCDQGASTGLHPLFPVLVVAQIIIGLGNTPMMTLGIAYLDDHVKKADSSLYLASCWLMLVLAPAVGFLLSAITLTWWVDLDRVDVSTVAISPLDPRWLGAWWLGFLFSGGLLVMMGVPFFCFPRALKKPDDDWEDIVPDSPKMVDTGKEGPKDVVVGMFRALKRILTNTIYMGITFMQVSALSVTYAFGVFMPKFLESHFQLAASDANSLIGLATIPGAAVGLFFGGFITKKFKWKSIRCINFCALTNVVVVIMYGGLWAFTCDNPFIPGLTLPYRSENATNGITLQAQCNTACNCSAERFDPVCGTDWMTYYSPCHAGCAGTTYTGPLATNYTDCSCVVAPTFSATPGKCFTACSARAQGFVALMFFMAFLAAAGQAPAFMVLLRSVSEADKSFALGLNYMAQRLFASIPSPIYFGAAIDGACLLWQTTCGQRGNCWLYDNTRFRQSYLGLATALQLLSIVFLVVAWLAVYRRKRNQDAKEDGDNGEESRKTKDRRPMWPLSLFQRPITRRYSEERIGPFALYDPRSLTYSTETINEGYTSNAMVNPAFVIESATQI